MANNRLYLVNKSQGIKILLAKYLPLPSVGMPLSWYIKDHYFLINSLEDGFSSIREDTQYGVEHPWTLEYETSPEDVLALTK
jgi:hypothetical protein